MAEAGPLRVAPLAAGDFAAWEPLWQGYLRFYGETLTEAMTALTFARLTGGDATMGGFLAWADGAGGPQAVGMVNYLTHRGTWTRGDHCYLEDLFVSPAARGTGAGRALITAVANAARARGCERMYWLTHETNATARALYDQLAEAPGMIQYRLDLG